MTWENIIEDFQETGNVHEFARHVHNKYQELLQSGLIGKEPKGKYWIEE